MKKIYLSFMVVALISTAAFAEKFSFEGEKIQKFLKNTPEITSDISAYMLTQPSSPITKIFGTLANPEAYRIDDESTCVYKYTYVLANQKKIVSQIAIKGNCPYVEQLTR